MVTASKTLATRMIRATAPKGGLDSFLKFCGFIAVIHTVSITAEFLLTGQLHMDHVMRFWVTFFTAAPFVGLTFYAVHRSWLLHKQLVAMASTDVLTGLMNRRAFVAEAARRLSSQDRGFILLVDADHFKRINDSFGHAVGDQCLRAIADRLRAVTPEADIVARIGGEEFGLHVDCAPDDIPALGAHICATIHVDHSDAVAAPLQVTLSVGVAQARPGDTLEQTMHRADHALYRAKQAGRARIMVWRAEVSEAGEMPLGDFGGRISPAVC
ncbi:GGDEF domain-containing protein [Loktanella sp. DJP18]|uniref:GGDEF domain-containing protein n=1 Tax=Loktanella sp. DJP18 TaxID=3409788 RepID=UPI003BB5DAA2